MCLQFAVNSFCSHKYPHIDCVYALRYSIDDLFHISCDFWMYLLMMVCQIFGFRRNDLVYNKIPERYSIPTTPSFCIWASEDDFNKGEPACQPIFKYCAWKEGSTCVPLIMLGLLIAMLGDQYFTGAVTFVAYAAQSLA